MATFPLPSPGPANQPYQFATIPASGATPSRLFIKNTTAAYVYDGTTLTKVTDADYPALTVWGVAYLDGTVYVMDTKAQIWGCDLLDPFTWTALNFISANSEGDTPVALARHLNYVLTFKESSTEILYNAGAAAPGSPLGKMTTSMMEVGCAVATSIAFTDNSLFYISSSKPKGRSVMRMDGFTPKKVSTPFVDRLLNVDNLSTVYAFVIKSNGHTFYVLTLVTLGVTLVYDEITGQWHTWTNLTLGQPNSATTVTDSVTGIVTFTVTSHDPQIQTLFPTYMTGNATAGHGLLDGDPISISGVLYYITHISSTQFSILPSVAIAATTTYSTYVESYFPGAYYTRGSNKDYILSVAGAKVYSFDTSTYQDDGLPINMKSRTQLEDWGVMAKKFFRRLEIVGDIEDTVLQLRYSDDDYGNWSTYRIITVDGDRAQIRAAGAGRRRAFEIRHMDNTPLRLLAIEADIDLGAR